jgi:TnpA family transposase
MGDGIMALFGAPIAHEDHAVRACYAALRMQETVHRYAEEARRAYGVTVQIRVGLNSGEVVVRAIGNDLRMDYTAVGETTHLAARMEQAARPGTVLIAPATRDLVEGFVAVKSLGPVPVKGRREPVEVYELSGIGPARTRLQAAARRGFTRFVGRDAEIKELCRALEHAGAGHGQAVAIVGEAGVGKSRLVWELTRSHRTHGWLVLESGAVRLPRVELSDLLIEVDSWTRFSDHFVHAAGADTLRPTLVPHLYASLFAHACNFGLEQMAHVTDMAYDQLAWCTTWYMREDTLKAAVTTLVNYHHSLPLSHRWGSGMLSPSDGQRFPVSGKNRHARPFPPPLGYGMGLTFYSWTSDQLSQYGTKFVPVSVRDATYVLDEICNNETELPIREHATDTAGATEIIFSLFDLLGFRFTSRLWDIGSRRLYASGPIALQDYPRLQPHVAGRIKRPRILDWWDETLRLTGSLKLGYVTASLMVQKLQAYPQQNALAQALQEYGRLVRTLHVLRWYANNEDRRRILRQLNKGEALHDLRAYLMIANKGQLRRKRGEELAHQASCLDLVTNAVILWNTMYMTAAIEQLKQEGYPVEESDLAHVWPTRYGHINVHGKYHFNMEEARGRKGLRPLRQPRRAG